MSVSLFRVGRDASGIAQRHATGVLTAGGGQANLNLIATGFGEADATFVINVPGPPPRLQYDREYVETDDPYNTFVSETDYDYSAGDIGTFGKLSYGITQPTRIYRYRCSQSWLIPDLTGYSVLSCVLNLYVNSIDASLETPTPLVYFMYGDNHTYPSGWWNSAYLLAGYIPMATGVQNISLDPSFIAGKSNQYLSLLYVTNEELTNSGSGAYGSAGANMTIKDSLSSMTLTLY